MNAQEINWEAASWHKLRHKFSLILLFDMYIVASLQNQSVKRA